MFRLHKTNINLCEDKDSSDETDALRKRGKRRERNMIERVFGRVRKICLERAACRGAAKRTKAPHACK